eukprot:m.164445 g.164445  ORF g.164445 m.164445 type:complete len:746 (-) comp16579_c0_seq1:931-3168(-)
MAPQDPGLFSDVEDDDVEDSPVPKPPLAEQHSEANEDHLSLIWLAFILFSGVVVFGAVLLLTAELTEAEASVDRVLTFLGMLASVAGIVLTYSVLGQLAFPSVWRFFQPLQGGVRFVALQIAAWTIFFFCLLLPMVPVIATFYYPDLMIKGFKLATGVLVILAQVVMVASLLAFDSDHSLAKPLRKIDPIGAIKRTQSDRWYSTFIGLQLLIAVGGSVMTVIADSYTGVSATVLFLSALCCFAFAAFLTYGIGGPWQHESRHWKFYQPGQGGRIFVALQGMAWACFTTASFLLLCEMENTVYPDDYVFFNLLTKASLPPVWVTAAIACLATVLNVISLTVYQGRPETIALASLPGNIVFRFLTVVTVSNLEKVVITFFVASLSLARVYPDIVVGTWVVLGSCYVFTYLGNPSMTGCRSRDWLFGSVWVEMAAAYFSLKVIYNNPRRLDPKHRYIFGFAPHGIMPLSAAYLTRTRTWMDAFPGIKPAVLSSSILHFVPLIRDAFQMLGGFEVTRDGIIAGLAHSGSAMLVPGGQLEMLDNDSSCKNVTLDTSHKGFVKLALQQAAKNPDHKYFLCPTYSFGETQLLDNIQTPRALQRFVTKLFGANIIFIPYGLGYLPGVPRPKPVTVVVGEAVEVPVCEHISLEHVELLHARYLDSLIAGIEAHKAKVLGNHEADAIVLKPPVRTLSERTFKRRFSSAKLQQTPVKLKPQRTSALEFTWMGLLLNALFWTVVYKAYGARLWEVLA